MQPQKCTCPGCRVMSLYPLSYMMSSSGYRFIKSKHVLWCFPRMVLIQVGCLYHSFTEIINKSLSTPHQAWLRPDVTKVGPSRFSASPVKFFCRHPRHLHPKTPIVSVLGHTHSHPQKGLVRTGSSTSVKQQPQMTSARGF